MTSAHYTNERGDREYIIKEIGYGEVIAKFEVDKGHRNGPEIHEVSDTGIVTIFNKRTHKLITKLIARPAQIRRYYEAIGQTAPQKVLEIAEKHQRLGYYNRQKKGDIKNDRDE